MTVLEVELEAFVDERALAVVAVHALRLTDFVHQPDRHQVRLLVLLVLERHVAVLEIRAAGAVAHLAADVGELGGRRDVDEAARLAPAGDVTADTGGIGRVVRVRVEAGAGLRFSGDSGFQRLEGLRHRGRFPRLVLLEVALLATLRAHVFELAVLSRHGSDAREHGDRGQGHYQESCISHVHSFSNPVRQSESIRFRAFPPVSVGSRSGRR